MAYRDKETTEAEAKRLGIDISGMTWPEMQKAVKQGLIREQMETEAPKPKKRKIESRPTKLSNGQVLAACKGQVLEIAPELRPDKNRAIMYYETLGDDLDIEEKKFYAGRTPDSAFPATRDYTTGTYRIKGKTGRKVVAESMIPKANARISYRVGVDWFPVVEFQGKRGYLFHHVRFPNFKQALIDSGYYGDYKQYIEDKKMTFYLCNIKCIDINAAHTIMREIEQRVKAEMEGKAWHR